MTAWNAFNMSANKRPFGIQLEVDNLNLRRKVSQVLSGGAFKDELETVLKNQISGSPRRSFVLKKLQETVIPASAIEAARQTASNAPSLQRGELIIPINDLRGSSSCKYTILERQLRCKLASVCRLVDMFGWSSLIDNLVTAVCSVKDQTALVNPFGLMSYEVTASNLVRVGYQGDIQDHGATQFGVDHTNLSMHLSIYAQNQDVRCIIPVCNSASIAVSCMHCGLLRMSEKALMVGKVSYISPDKNIDMDLNSKILFVHGCGLLAVGQSIEEAFHFAYHAAKACEIQVSAIAAGVGSLFAFVNIPTEPRTADLQHEFEGLMRMLDNKGYNTGYEFKFWDLFSSPPDAGYEVRRKIREVKRIRMQPIEKDIHTLSGTSLLMKTNESSWPQTLNSSPQTWQNEVTNFSKRLPNSSTLLQRNSNMKSYEEPRAPPKVSLPNCISHSEASSIQPLEWARIAAKKVAISTNQAVEMLMSQRTFATESSLQKYHLPATTGMVALAPEPEATPPFTGHWQFQASGSDVHVQNSHYHANGSGSNAQNTSGQVMAEKVACVARDVAKNTEEAVQRMPASMK